MFWNQTRRGKRIQIKSRICGGNGILVYFFLTKRNESDRKRRGGYLSDDGSESERERELKNKLAEGISFLELPWNLRESKRDGERKRVVVSRVERERRRTPNRSGNVALLIHPCFIYSSRVFFFLIILFFSIGLPPFIPTNQLFFNC